MKKTERYSISITAEDIKEGRRVDPHGCPIARAAKRSMGEGVCVGPSGIKLHGKWWPIPAQAKAFMLDYDTGMRCRCFPFTFEMEIKW